MRPSARTHPGKPCCIATEGRAIRIGPELVAGPETIDWGWGSSTQEYEYEPDESEYYEKK